MSEARTFKTAAYAHLADVGKALASGTRLEILELLAQAPRSVEALASAVGQSVANTSHHLGVLKRAQLVRSEKAGLRRVHAVAGDDVRALLAQLHAVASGRVAALSQLSREYLGERDGLEPIDRDTLLLRLRDGDAVLVDVRPEHEFVAGHLPGALSIPVGELAERLDELPRDRAIVAYCRGPFCAFSADAARELRALGFEAHRSEISAANPADRALLARAVVSGCGAEQGRAR